jgi:hypothetical protein
MFGLLLIGLTPGLLQAESFETYTNQRFVDTAGNYYVAVKREAGSPRYRSAWGPVELTIARRKPSSAPVPRVRARLVDLENQGTVLDTQAANDVDVRSGDTVLGRAKVTHPPLLVLVSSTGLGVVLLDLYGLDSMLLTQGEPAVTVLSTNGKVAYTAKLSELFQSADWAGFTRTMSGCVWWLRDAWIDEERREVVIVAKCNSAKGTYPLAVLRLDTGVIRHGSNRDVLRAIATRNPAGLRPALDAVATVDLNEARPHLKAILQDGAQPLNARLRCAVFLSSLGDKSGRELLATATLTVSKQLLEHPDRQDLENERLWEMYTYAIRHLPDVLGDECLPVLNEAGRLQGYPPSVYQAFRQMGNRALPVLLDLLEDEKEVDGQIMAADLLSNLKPPAKRAIVALIKALESGATTKSGCHLRWVAARCLSELGPAAKAALPTLAKLADGSDEEVRKAAAEAIASIKR